MVNNLVAKRKPLRGVNYELPTCPAKLTGRRRDYYMQNKPNFRTAEMNITSAITKDYENIPPTKKCENKPNQTQFQPQICKTNPNRTQFQPKNEANKPNRTQFQPKNGLFDVCGSRLCDELYHIVSLASNLRVKIGHPRRPLAILSI